MEIGDDTNANLNDSTPGTEMKIMDGLNLTTALPYSSPTSMPLITQTGPQHLANSTDPTSPNAKPSLTLTISDVSRPPSSPDVTCSSTTSSLPSHSYISEGRRYTVYEVFIGYIV